MSAVRLRTALLVRGLASVGIVNGVPDEYIAVWARFFDFGTSRMPSFLAKLAGDA